MDTRTNIVYSTLEKLKHFFVLILPQNSHKILLLVGVSMKYTYPEHVITTCTIVEEIKYELINGVPT